MKIALIGIYDRGELSKERVHFRALFDIDLRFYTVLDTQYQSIFGNTVEANNKSCFWFVPFQVKAGQNIVLYTRNGNHGTETRNDGTVFHFFFRGLAQPIYTAQSKCAVILELNNWVTSSYF